MQYFAGVPQNVTSVVHEGEHVRERSAVHVALHWIHECTIQQRKQQRGNGKDCVRRYSQRKQEI